MCIHSCMTTSTPRGAGYPAQRMDNTVSIACTLISPDRGSLAFSGPISTMLLSLIQLCSCKDLSVATPLLFKLWSLWCLQMVYTPKSIAEMSTQTQTHAHMCMWMHTHTSACTWECSCTYTSWPHKHIHWQLNGCNKWWQMNGSKPNPKDEN